MSQALSRRPGARDARHLMRYIKSKVMDPAAIAKAEHVSLSTVMESIKSVEVYEQQNTDGQLQLAVRDLVISTIPQAKETLQGLLTATEVVMKKNLKTGKDEYVTVEDKTTRLEGARLVRDLVIGMQPKGPGVAVNVNQTNQTANIANASETTEERMRRIRQKIQEHNLLPPQVSAVPDYIDQGEDSPDDEHDDDDEGEDEA
jgi:predicted RNA-binding protein with TRAM domain